MYETRRERLKAGLKIISLLLDVKVKNRLGRKEEILFFGDRIKKVRLPPWTDIIPRPKPLPTLKNPVKRLEDVLSSPIDMEPFPELVKSNYRITIAFDDCCVPVPPMRKPDAREIIIRKILQELRRLGVQKQNIFLLCANGLHRKWRQKELGTILGKIAFGPYPLICHDAEDKENLTYFGETEMGHEVEVNRLVEDSDLLIYVNVNMTSMNGGWKSICVGLGSYRSIRWNHSPEFIGSPISILNPSSPFHDSLRENG